MHLGGGIWELEIAPQSIIENAGATVTQGSMSAILATALPTLWILGIAPQYVTEPRTSVTQGGEWMQGTAKVFLKTALTGPSTSVIITAASGVTFVTTIDVVIGSNTVALANVNAITNSVPDTGVGTLKTAVSNEWTLDIPAQGTTESIGSTVIQGTSTGTLKNALFNEWTVDIASQTVIESVGATINQGSIAGTLKSAIPTEFTLAIAAQGITEAAGVTVTQGLSATGTLKTSLSNEWTLIIDPTSLTENAGVAVVQAGNAATASTFAGGSFIAYDFSTNDETLTVVVDGSDVAIHF